MKPSTSNDSLDLLRARYARLLPEKAATMSAALERHDYPAISALSHQLRGSGKSYGFDQVTMLAGEIENACDDHRPTEVARLIVEFTHVAATLAAASTESLPR